MYIYKLIIKAFISSVTKYEPLTIFHRESKKKESSTFGLDNPSTPRNM